MDIISPLAPEKFPVVPPISGVGMASGQCRLKPGNNSDVLLVELKPNTVAAGVFTKSTTAAAPVTWCRSILSIEEARGLVVNSVNANAFTGSEGDLAVRKIASVAADLIGCRTDQVYIAQTGVIGEHLLYERITLNLPEIYSRLGTNWEQAADAISTTDTYPKGCFRFSEIDGKKVVISGIAKGSGMIAPNMATMLAFIFTDAAIAKSELQKLITECTDKTFNSITVDSDTSTNDTVLAFATGMAENIGYPAESEQLKSFRESLYEVMLDLAHQIVCDGEGASKFIEIRLSGAENDKAAKTVAFAIANSPLVKTAIAGEDANWGRIIMAVGKAKEIIDSNNIDLSIGGVQITRGGSVISGYDEALVTKHMKGNNILIEIYIGSGSGSAVVWTCDLTHRYISINADYRS